METTIKVGDKFKIGRVLVTVTDVRVDFENDGTEYLAGFVEDEGGEYTFTVKGGQFIAESL